MHSNLAVTETETIAFFLAGGVDWYATQPDQRATVIGEQAQRLSEMTGRRVWLRGLHVPFPVDQFRDGLAADYPAGAGPEWDDLVDRACAFPVKFGATQPAVVIGAVIGGPIERENLPRVLADVTDPAATKNKVARARITYRKLAASLAGDGFAAHPLAGAGLEWVFTRSRALGHDVPSPGQLDRDGWATPAVEATGTQSEDQAAVRVRAVIDGRPSVRWTHVMRLAQARPREATTSTPWLAWALAQPERIEWAACYDVMDGKSVTAAAATRLRIVSQQATHHEEHGEPVGETLADAIDLGSSVADVTAHGGDVDGARGWGQVLFAVSGDTEQDALDIADRVKAAAARPPERGGPGLKLDSAPGQWADYRRFIPGERWTMRGHLVRHPVTFIAAGVPNASPRAGDAVGVPIGNIAGSNDIFTFDPFGGVKAGRPGVCGIVGEQGSGKTSLLLLFAYWLTAGGVPGTAYDPSGLMRSVLDTPAMRGRGREFRLTSGAAGSLAPHFLVPEPRRGDYGPHSEYVEAVAAARGERMSTAIDAVMMSLPIAAVERPDTQAIVEAAVAAVGGDYGVHPRDIIDAIARESEQGPALARQVEARAALPGGRLMFPERDVDEDAFAAFDEDASFTLVTTPGLVPPPESHVPLGQWTQDQLRSRPILTLGSRFASRSIWANRERKFFLSDELSLAASGASSWVPFVQRVSFDSRKFACAAVFAMQAAGTFDRLGDNALSMFAAAFVGRTEKRNAAAALPLLGLPAGEGWEDVIATLNPSRGARSFVVSGWDDRPREVVADQGWWPAELRTAAYTTPVASGGRVLAAIGER